MFRKSIKMFILILVLLILSLKFQALAQDNYPNRPIEIIIPGIAGMTTDLSIRFFADKWAEFLGQPVVPVNKPGAMGSIGCRYVANAKPDGYTLLTTGDMAIICAPLERKDIGYNYESFRYPITFGYITLFFTVRSDSRWKTLNDFLKEAKENPGKLKYATMGQRHHAALMTDMICQQAGAKVTLIPHKGSNDCLTGLIGGNVDMAVTNGLVGFGGTGMIRPLAVAYEVRLPDYPEVPTLIELGYKFKYPPHLVGVAAPRKTPENVLSKLIEAHKKVRIKYLKEIEEKLPLASVYPVENMEDKVLYEYYKSKDKLFKEYFEKIGVKPE